MTKKQWAIIQSRAKRVIRRLENAVLAELLEAGKQGRFDRVPVPGVVEAETMHFLEKHLRFTLEDFLG